MASLFPRLRRPAPPSPVPEADAAGAWDEATAVAHYDTVTQQVAVADLAQLLAQAQPTQAVPVLRRPPRAAKGTSQTESPRRRSRFALGLLAFLVLGAAWAAAAYQAWYFFLR